MKHDIYCRCVSVCNEYGQNIVESRNLPNGNQTPLASKRIFLHMRCYMYLDHRTAGFATTQWRRGSGYICSLAPIVERFYSVLWYNDRERRDGGELHKAAMSYADGTEKKTNKSRSTYKHYLVCINKSHIIEMKMNISYNRCVKIWMNWRWEKWRKFKPHKYAETQHKYEITMLPKSISHTQLHKSMFFLFFCFL